MVYQWKDAAHIKADAQTAGQVCEELESSGGLTPRRLVEASRPPDAPLHGAFEWDDATAAELYRERQAGHIIRCLIKAPETPKEAPVRAFFPVSAANHYTHITRITSSEELQNTMLDQALRELAAYRRKYEALKELRDVFLAADRAISRRQAGTEGARATV